MDMQQARLLAQMGDYKPDPIYETFTVEGQDYMPTWMLQKGWKRYDRFFLAGSRDNPRLYFGVACIAWVDPESDVLIHFREIVSDPVTIDDDIGRHILVNDEVMENPRTASGVQRMLKQLSIRFGLRYRWDGGDTFFMMKMKRFGDRYIAKVGA